jgi:acetyl esterase/lipase
MAIAVSSAFRPMGVPRADAQTGPTVERDVVYRTVDGERLTADVFLPPATGAARPAVLVIHGGGWSEGNKEEAAWAGLGLASFGFVAVTIDYRLAPRYPYPAAVDDVEAAVRWLRRPHQVDAYEIDPARIAAGGGSAGGHLAALLATRGEGRTDRGARVAAAVSWSGPMDLRPEAALVDRDGQDARGLVTTFLGCRADDCPARRARAASPFTHVDPTDPPMLFTSAEVDWVPPETLTPMLDALSAAGVEHELVIVPGTGHSESLALAVGAETLGFLQDHLFPAVPEPPA